jgi:hypothetical protein
MLSSAIVVSLSSSVLYFQRREDDAVAASLHGLPVAVTPSLGTRPLAKPVSNQRQGHGRREGNEPIHSGYPSLRS